MAKYGYDGRLMLASNQNILRCLGPVASFHRQQHHFNGLLPRIQWTRMTRDIRTC